MSDTPPQEIPENEPEGIQNLRSAHAEQGKENRELKQELSFAKLGISPNETQKKALESVFDGDWRDDAAVGQVYTELFGAPSEATTSPTDPDPQAADTSGEQVLEAPAPPGGAILDHVSGVTGGQTAPPGEAIQEDPVRAGFSERRKDLNAGRPKKDAAAQVINRLIDRGAKDLPGGVYEPDSYRQALEEGRAGQPPDVRLVD